MDLEPWGIHNTYEYSNERNIDIRLLQRSICNKMDPDVALNDSWERND